MRTRLLPVYLGTSFLSCLVLYASKGINPSGNAQSIEYNNLELVQDNLQLNVKKQPLTICSTKPMTGFYRDGYCQTGPNDSGTHVVCAQVTEPFLSFNKARGNDLSTPRGSSFPGLKPGDGWCVCVGRWKDAYANGIYAPVNLDATNIAALNYAPIEQYSILPK